MVQTPPHMHHVWFVWSKTSYSGDKWRCYQCGRTNDQQANIGLLSFWSVNRWVSQNWHLWRIHYKTHHFSLDMIEHELSFLKSSFCEIVRNRQPFPASLDNLFKVWKSFGNDISAFQKWEFTVHNWQLTACQLCRKFRLLQLGGKFDWLWFDFS